MRSNKFRHEFAYSETLTSPICIAERIDSRVLDPHPKAPISDSSTSASTSARCELVDAASPVKVKYLMASQSICEGLQL